MKQLKHVAIDVISTFAEVTKAWVIGLLLLIAISIPLYFVYSINPILLGIVFGLFFAWVISQH